MTSQKDQIQTLIAEIDKVLQKPSTRLPWVMSGETAQQRRVLERVRSYLVSLQQKMAVDEQFSQARTKSNLSTYDIQYQPNQAIDYPRPAIAPIGNTQDEAARQILQAVVQEMDHLRTSLTQPLQADLEALRQQRESLMQEIRQLEAQRQHYSLAQQQANQQKIISEFLQVLMGRLQDSLAQQVAQTLSTLQTQAPYELNSNDPIALSGRGAAEQPLLNPGQRLEQLQMLQARSDQLLMNLDSTLSVVFDALQRNVQSYQESLSTGLERMHGLGQQGEVMFTALVSHLAQQLGREASSFLHSSLPAPELASGQVSSSTAAQLTSVTPTQLDSVPPATQPDKPPAQASPSRNLEPVPLDLPYAGAELQRDSDRSSTSEPLLPELDHVDGLEDLNLEDLDLADIDLNDELDTLLDVDLSPVDGDQAAPASSLHQDSSQASTPPFAKPAQNSPVVFPNAATSASELEFLEQLDIALHQEDEPVSEASPATTELMELEDWGGETTSQPTEAFAATTESEVEADDLYASLFGSDDLAGVVEPTDLDNTVSSAEPTPAIADLAATFDLEETSELTDPTTGIQSDLTGATLEDFLFADAEPVAPEAPETAPDVPSLNEFSEATEQSAVFGTPDTTASSSATDPAALNLEDFQSSFIDEPDQSDSLVELAELLDNAEVVETEPSTAIASTRFSDFAAQSSTEESETENERLLSELSLQDIPNLGVNNAANPLDDAYVPAAPEEYLIAMDDDLGDETEAGLWLDDTIVQQLNEDLFTLEESDPLASPSAAFAPDPPAWDNLTLEDFAETLPETLPSVEPEISDTPDGLSSNPSTFWEDAELPAIPAETPADLTLDDFDLLVDSPTTPPSPANSQVTPAPAPPQSSDRQRTGLDTQDLTLDDAFMDFLETTSQPEMDSSDRNLAPPNPSDLPSDEKKKRQ